MVGESLESNTVGVMDDDSGMNMEEMSRADMDVKATVMPAGRVASVCTCHTTGTTQYRL